MTVQKENYENQPLTSTEKDLMEFSTDEHISHPVKWIVHITCKILSQYANISIQFKASVFV